MVQSRQLFGEGFRRTQGNPARRYNLLAARLIADIAKGLLGPRGMEKMFIDILGETTVTKDGATLLRKLDVEHPAAKVIIESSNAVEPKICQSIKTILMVKQCCVWQGPVYIRSWYLWLS
jgi:hypothetical protein